MRLNLRLLILIIGCTSQQVYANFGLSAKPEFSAKLGWEIHFAIQNQTGYIKRATNSAMPWGIRSSIVTRLVCFGAIASCVEPPLIIDDPRIDPIELTPQQPATGKITLTERYPNFTVQDAYEKSFGFCFQYKLSNLDPLNRTLHEQCFVLPQQIRKTKLPLQRSPPIRKLP